MITQRYVSIPFKRERGSKATLDSTNPSPEVSFNSLQTGKGIQRKKKSNFARNHTTVSIPFKRERGSKGNSELQSGVGLEKVSIPFKRERGSKVKWQQNCIRKRHNTFQFPSNGKGDPKRPCFKPSGAVAPYVQNQTRTARGNF